MRTETRCSSGDLLYTAQAYGAKIWLANIQRTCQRFLHSSLGPPHRHDFGEGMVHAFSNKINKV